jgi:GPI inositol-deacylase
LDFFTADFNEDITAFHGQTLQDQAEYLNDAVAYILSLYHDPDRPRRDPGLPDPTSVIIIGHSMGGIVARTMLTMPNYQANSVNTIITLSAPHARAPVSFDADIVSTYERINGYWRQAYSQKWANDNPLWHVTLISIAGGGLDTVVPSDYSSLASLVPETHGFTVFTSTIPDVWTGSDHLCILWCDQLRKAIVKSLFDVVDIRRSGQTKPRAERMRLFRKRFLTGMEDFSEKASQSKEANTLLTLEDEANTILSTGERLVVSEMGKTGKVKAYLLPVPATQEMPSEKKFILLTNQAVESSGSLKNMEVLLCSVFPLHPGQSASVFSMDMDLSGTSTGSTRLACKSAVPDAIRLPASTASSSHPFDAAEPFTYFQYDVEDITEYQFVAVVDKNTLPTNNWIIAEFSENSHSQIYTGASLGKLIFKGLDLTLPAERPMMTEIKIPAIYSSLLVYKLRVGVQACADKSLFTPLIRQYISEPYESKYFVNVKEADINLHGVSPFMPPSLRSVSAANGLSLQLWSDPTCGTSINISLDIDLIGSLGKLVMRYRTVYPAIPLVVIALVLRKQFVIHDKTGIFITFFESLDLCLRSSLPVLFSAMTLFSLSMANSSSSSGSMMPWGGNATETAIDYTKNDLLLGSSDPFFWYLVPLAGLIGAGACVLVNYAALGLIHILYLLYATALSTIRRFRRNHYRRNTGNVFSSASPRRRIAITLLLFLLISTVIPYQFAYIVACVVQMMTCTRALGAAQEAVGNSECLFAKLTCLSVRLQLTTFSIMHIRFSS